MNTVKDLHDALSDQVTRLQPSPGLEARVLQQVRGLTTSRAIPNVNGEAMEPSRRAVRRLARRTDIDSHRGLAVVAALLAAAVVFTLVLTGRALHPSPPIPANAGSVPSAKPIPIGPAISTGCTSSCGSSDPVFATASVGWIERGNQLFRTDDGGTLWRAMVSWQNPLLPGPSYGSDQIEVNADGSEVLLITTWGVNGVGLVHTSDAGRTWASFGFPSAARRTQQSCTSPQCDPVAVFLNPREGWVASHDVNSNIGDLFRTTDSGAHWRLVAHFSVGGSIDLLRGQLVLETSTSAIYVPTYEGRPAISRTMYRTQDGGRSWQAISLAIPSTLGLYSNNASIGLVKFFGGGTGIAELESVHANGCCQADGSPSSYSPDGDQGGFFVYTTSDGGRTWSSPAPIPPAFLQDFIDRTHWIEGYLVTTTGVANPGRSPLQRTRDGGLHWEPVSYAVTGLPAGSLVRVNPYGFLDPLHGWGQVSCAAILVVTTDGGVTWSPIVPPGGQLPRTPIRDCEP